MALPVQKQIEADGGKSYERAVEGGCAMDMTSDLQANQLPYLQPCNDTTFEYASLETRLLLNHTTTNVPKQGKGENFCSCSVEGHFQTIFKKLMSF